MEWILWVIFMLIALVSIGLFIAIIVRQEKIDAPVKGLLVIESSDPEKPCEVYLASCSKGVVLDEEPKTFTDGQLIKLEVCAIKGGSQGKQATE